MPKKPNLFTGYPVLLLAGGATGMVIGGLIEDIPIGVIIGCAIGGVLLLLFSGLNQDGSASREAREEERRED